VAQTLVALLDSLDMEMEMRPHWQTVKVEPKISSQKVDILWEYENGHQTAVQVKSTRRVFKSANSITKWARELVTKWDSPNTNYEVHLVGQVRDSARIDSVKVVVPTGERVVVIKYYPTSDLGLLRRAAAQLLVVFLEQNAQLHLKSQDAGLLIDALHTRFQFNSAFQKPLSRARLVEVLRKYITPLCSDPAPSPSLPFDFSAVDAEIAPKVKLYLAQRTKTLLQTECGRFVEPHLLVWDAEGRWEGPAEGKAGQKRIAGEAVKRLLRGETGAVSPVVRGARLAIRGDSGLGKSILMVWAESLLAEAEGPIVPLRFGAGPKTTTQPGSSGEVIPLWQQVFGWDPNLQGPARIEAVEGALFDHVVGPLLIDAKVQESEGIRRRWFQEKLRRGEFAWLMDALDQAGDAPQQRIQTLLGEPWHRCPVVLSARFELSQAQRTAYAQTTTQSRWHEVDIAPFNEQQIHEFLEHKDIRDKLLVQVGDLWEVGQRKRYWRDLLAFPILARQLRDFARSQARGAQKSLEHLRNREAVYQATLGELLERGHNSLTEEERTRYDENLFLVPGKLQEAAWMSLSTEVTATRSLAGFDGILRREAYEKLKLWLRQAQFPHELLAKINLLRFFEEEVETVEGVDRSYARWRHKSFGEWFAGQHLVESAEARQELPKLLRDPRWRDTVRYALSAAARQRKGDVLQELVGMLIRGGRVFWVWEALSNDRLSAQYTDAGPSGGTSRTAPVVIEPAWDTLCRWLVHRDWDGYGAWNAECPLSEVESTVKAWSSLFDRGVREGRALSAAWELVKRGQDSKDPQVRDESVKLYNHFLGEWPELVAGRDPLSQRSLDQQTVRLVRGLAWDRDRDLAEVKVGQPVTEVRYCRVPPQGDTHSYQMGSPKDEPDRFDDEEQQSVTVRAFWLRNFPVTNGEYELFDPGHRERRTEYSTADDQPVVNVSWWECQLLCEWLGGAYRLPTEKEWEGACRAGTQTAYWYGAAPDELPQHAWFDENSDGRTHELKDSLKKGKVPGEGHVNRWGLVDMHGNVWEWCAPRGDAPLGRPCPSRGGSWYYDAGACRSASRFARIPEYRSGNLGLRLVPSPSQPDREAQPDAQVRTRSGGSP
jgi:hypothetical protein